MTGTPQASADDDTERLTRIRYQNEEARTIPPGHTEIAFLLRLLGSRGAALREAREENKRLVLLNGDLALDAVETARRMNKNYSNLLTERDEAREDAANLRKVLAAAAEELRLIRMKDTSADSGTTAVTDAMQDVARRFPDIRANDCREVARAACSALSVIITEQGGGE